MMIGVGVDCTGTTRIGVRSDGGRQWGTALGGDRGGDGNGEIMIQIGPDTFGNRVGERKGVSWEAKD